MSGGSGSADAIDRAEAHVYARGVHQLAVRAQLAGLEALGAGEVDGDATTIYDLNGEALFYDFQVNGSLETTGTIRAAATKARAAGVAAGDRDAARARATRARDRLAAGLLRLSQDRG
jgi:hypothetical protein